LGQLIEYKCPIGLLFDSVSKQCDFPNKVVCTEKVLTTTNKRMHANKYVLIKYLINNIS